MVPRCPGKRIQHDDDQSEPTEQRYLGIFLEDGGDDEGRTSSAPVKVVHGKVDGKTSSSAHSVRSASTVGSAGTNSRARAADAPAREAQPHPVSKKPKVGSVTTGALTPSPGHAQGNGLDNVRFLVVDPIVPH